MNDNKVNVVTVRWWDGYKNANYGIYTIFK